MKFVFDHACYVPVLRLKGAEKGALRYLAPKDHANRAASGACRHNKQFADPRRVSVPVFKSVLLLSAHCSLPTAHCFPP
jgi:hypothetical protein